MRLDHLLTLTLTTVCAERLSGGPACTRARRSAVDRRLCEAKALGSNPSESICTRQVLLSGKDGWQAAFCCLSGEVVIGTSQPRHPLGKWRERMLLALCHLVDGSAQGAEEGRAKLRKASGRRREP